MTPAARLQAAIDILDEMNRSLVASDKFLRGWWGARRFAGSKDRAAVSERVYAVLRRRASLSWRMQSDSPRALVIASLLAEGASPTAIEGLFDGSQYGPQSLSSEEKAAIVGTPAPPPDYVCGDFPEWLDSELRRSLGDSLLPEMAAMRERAAVDLRVNTLKAQRDDMLVGLQALDMETRVTSFSPWGLRLDSDQRLSMLSHTQFFQTGAFEFQDEASQLVALLCAAKRGERVLDIAAGAGGKSLALAAAMNNEGEILACDVDIARLRALGPRARRAGVTIIRTQGLDDAPLEPIFDVVLVDAPCSGSGTWRRNPETKWRLTSERLGELTQIQRALLERAANAVRPGGRLVYSVCSLFPSEGQDQVDNFLASRPAFRLDPVESAWDKAGSGTRPPGLGKVLSTSPARTGTDGFFAGVMVRGDKITMV